MHSYLPDCAASSSRLQSALNRQGLRTGGQATERAHINPESKGSAPRGLQVASDEELRRLLAAHSGSRAELAAQLGMSERTLYRKIKSLG